jgi:hypothetical protein
MNTEAGNNILAGGVGSPVEFELNHQFTHEWPIDPIREAAARLLNDLVGLGRDRDGYVGRLAAVARFLQALALCGVPERGRAIGWLAVPFVLLAELLDATPASEAAAFFRHRVILRFERAQLGAAVQALHRLGWWRRRAGEHVGRLAGVPWKRAVGWRDTMQREPPVTFAELQEQLKAALDRDPNARVRQRKDVAIYTEALRLAKDDDEAELLARIEGWVLPLNPRKLRPLLRGKRREKAPGTP